MNLIVNLQSIHIYQLLEMHYFFLPGAQVYGFSFALLMRNLGNAVKLIVSIHKAIIWNKMVRAPVILETCKSPVAP